MTSTERIIVEKLLQIKAIKLNPTNPFIWASGWKSPIYCDNRKTLAYPEVRELIKKEFISIINEKFLPVDVIAGVATGAISHGVLVAQELNLPFVYVRSSPKGHGLKNLIEGEIQKGQTVVVIEDLVSTGGSSLKAVEALRDAGCIVKVLIAIFSYGFKIAQDNFKNTNCKLVSLVNYDTLINHAVGNGYINQSNMEMLKTWRENPEKWSP